MGSAGAVRAGKAYVEIHGQDEGLKSTLKSDATAFAAWGQRVTQIGQRAGSAFAAATRTMGNAAKAVGSATSGLAKKIPSVSVIRVAVAAVGVSALAAAVKAFAENAGKLSTLKGSGISPADVKNARQLDVAMSTLGTSIQIAWAQIAAAVAPTLTKIINRVSVLVQGFTKWAQVNRPLIASIIEMAVKIGVFAAGLFLAVKAIAIITAGIALFASPLGILAALLAAGVASWAAWSTSGQQAVGYLQSSAGGVIGWLQERFAEFYKDFQMVWGGIVAAISAGDLAAAAEMAWLGLQLAFFETVKALGGNWNSFYTTFLQTVALIGDSWDVLFTRLTQGFDLAFSRIRQGWRSTQNLLAKGIAIVLGVVEGKTADERQQILDELDSMATFDNKAVEDSMQKRNKEREAKLEKNIMDRQSELTDELNSLPASDQDRIDGLRKKLTSLAELAKTAAGPGAADTPTFYPEKSNIASAGTFNAAAIRGVAGGGPLDLIAENTKQTAANTKNLRRSGNLTFAGSGEN